MQPKGSTPFWKSASLSGRISSSENEKLVAAGPVSRILRVTLQPRKLLKRKAGRVSRMSRSSASAGFASHQRHNRRGLYRDLRNATGKKTPKSREAYKSEKTGKQQLGPGHLPRNPLNRR